MSDIVFSTENNIEEKKDGKRPFVLSLTFLKWIAAISSALLVLELLFSFFIVPLFRSPRILYSPTQNYSKADLDLAISEANRGSWLSFDLNKAAALLAALPGIESASVTRSFPDKIIVNISERIPVALSLMEIEGRSVPIQIDRSGVVFTSPAERSDESLPLITGISIESVDSQYRIPVKYRPLMGRIADLNALPRKFFAAFSEIHVVPKQYGNYELVLYPVHSRIRVLVDRNFDETVLENMMVALDVMNRIAPNATELDLRYGSITYR